MGEALAEKSHIFSAPFASHKKMLQKVGACYISGPNCTHSRGDLCLAPFPAPNQCDRRLRCSVVLPLFCLLLSRPLLSSRRLHVRVSAPPNSPFSRQPVSCVVCSHSIAATQSLQSGRGLPTPNSLALSSIPALLPSCQWNWCCAACCCWCRKTDRGALGEN